LEISYLPVQTLTFEAVEQDEVPEILQPAFSQAFLFLKLSSLLFSLHCWQPFELPDPHITHLSPAEMLTNGIERAKIRVNSKVFKFILYLS
jgi:hypothetical protein